MGGIAAIAREAGHKVTGCDVGAYPPMSTQLKSQNIELIEGFSPEQIELNPDIFVIGNVVTRGNPLMEEILNHNLPYTSGPQWLYENVLKNKWVLAVAGTHGKTTTSSMLLWILEYVGIKPGFLIGGIPENFGISARLGNESPFFVIEADEYDTAFFDKRSKFVHYRPKTVILNNLEFDHSDIFCDLAAIMQQFHHLIRLIPSNGLIVSNYQEENLKQVLAKGCWAPVEKIGVNDGWQAKILHDDRINITLNDKSQGILQWELMGEHNRMNALSALAAAIHIGIPVKTSITALEQFKNVKRRMEIRGIINNITIYDDFAHHPTAIQKTLEGLRHRIKEARIIAVLEPRSNTMRMGTWKDSLAESLGVADLIFCYTADLGWNVQEALKSLGTRAVTNNNLDQLILLIIATLCPNDHVLIMSNGNFGNIHERLIKALEKNCTQ